MHWYDYIWQAAVVLMPFIFAGVKASEINNNRWGQVLLPAAETTWHAVEAWKTQQAPKPQAPTSKAEFLNRMTMIVKGLSDSEKERLSTWADTRSLADKAPQNQRN